MTDSRAKDTIDMTETMTETQSTETYVRLNTSSPDDGGPRVIALADLVLVGADG